MQSETSGLMGKRSNLVFGLAISVLVVLYAGVFIARPEQLFADDTYFYLQVAWNFARGMGSTFNTLMPTNGYHPLWMLLCAVVYKVLPSRIAGMHGVAVLTSVLDGLMLWTVRRLLKQVAGDLWVLAFALLIPFSFLSQLGTEGALSGLFLALVMLHAYAMGESPSSRTAVLFNLEAALAVLSRLDNIFIIGFIWAAVWIELTRKGERSGRRLQLAMLPTYAALWGAYLGSNWIYFHTIQPISGLLKSKSAVTHALKDHFPHTALFAMVLILVCFTVVALRKRDMFFRVVEVPFFLGVIVHGTYIVLRMSSETRWTWYYTSWILLGAVLLARASSAVLAPRRWLVTPTAAILVLLLAVGWVKLSYKRCYLGPSLRPPQSFIDAVSRKTGIHNAFVFDEPGYVAYFTDLKIIPLDGLMGDLAFQHDLATKGVHAVATEYQIDGFIGPGEPFDKASAKDHCDQLFLASVELHCEADGPGRWRVISADVYSRVPGALAGRLPLDKDQIVWSQKDLLTVWRITPSVEAR
jgi:hypothetical protein